MNGEAASKEGAPQDERMPAHLPGWGATPRTIAEQIADDMSAALLRGALRPGHRLVEQDISRSYGVSRGPVREAIRMLERRGLVQIFPRRGAYAVGLSLDTIADSFNIVAVLLGLASRCFALLQPGDGLRELSERLLVLRSSVTSTQVDATDFARHNGRVATVVYRHCGNVALKRMHSEQINSAQWSVIWHQSPVDYLTPERREEAAAEWEAAAAAISAGRIAETERLVRAIVFVARDRVIEALQEIRQETVDKAKLFHD